jgi:putative membrane protein
VAPQDRCGVLRITRQNAAVGPGLVAPGIALALYAHAFVRLRRRGRAPTWNALLYALGLGVGVAAILPRVDRLADDLLAAHMAQHLLLGDLMPLLLVLGVRGPVAVFLLPKRVLVRLARLRPLVWLVSRLLQPRVAFGVWLVALAAWHVPAAYDAAEAHGSVHALEHLSFAFAGVLVWTQILDPVRRRRMSEGARAGFAGIVLVAGMALGEVLVAAHPLYPHYVHVADRPFGWSASEDQTRAGFVMMAEQLATLGMAAALLLWDHVERVGRELGPA